MNIKGRLIAEGTEYELIRFTRTPEAGGTWNGLQFVNTMNDNSISYAIVEYGRTNEGMVGLENSSLSLNHVTLDNTTLSPIPVPMDKRPRTTALSTSGAAAYQPAAGSLSRTTFSEPPRATTTQSTSTESHAPILSRKS